MIHLEMALDRGESTPFPLQLSLRELKRGKFKEEKAERNTVILRESEPEMWGEKQKPASRLLTKD